jgi:hypothetical protein
MIERLCQIPGRNPGRTILALTVLMTLAYSAGVVLLPKRDGRIVVGDTSHYYVYLRSTVFDHDLNFQNDYIRLYGLNGTEPGTKWVYEPTATGHVRNMMSIGPPLVWAPMFLLVTAGVAIARLFGSTLPLDGFGAPFQASVGLAGVVAAGIGVWLTYRLCARFFDRTVAIWSTLTVWLASSAVYYSVIAPGYSHSSSMLVVSAFFLAWASSLDDQRTFRYARLGALVGLCALVRWQDAVFLVVPLVDAVWQAAEDRPTRPVGRTLSDFAARMTACGVAALVAFSPQVLVWQVLYGQWLAMPQGSGWMQWASPHVVKVLFSDWHGLFTWTPVLLLAVAGLAWLWPRAPRLTAGLAAAFLASLYANGAVIEWWAGEAYGARRFVSCYPIFVLGLAAVAERFYRPLVRQAAVGAVFITLNGLLLLQYQTFMHGLRTVAAYPNGFYGLVVARFEVPFRLLEWWIHR